MTLAIAAVLWLAGYAMIATDDRVLDLIRGNPWHLQFSAHLSLLCGLWPLIAVALLGVK